MKKKANLKTQGITVNSHKSVAETRIFEPIVVHTKSTNANQANAGDTEVPNGPLTPTPNFDWYESIEQEDHNVNLNPVVPADDIEVPDALPSTRGF